MDAPESVKAYQGAIRELIAKDQVRIPPYPAVAFRISALIRSNEYHLDDLANLVSTDQSLSVEMLRLVNSAAYWSSSPVTSARVAVNRIGARQVAALALASGLGAEVKAPGPLDLLRRQIWQEGVTSALLCQKLAGLRNAPPEEAFTCGLLHDFGRVVAVACVEQILKNRPTAPAQAAEHWSEVVESVHVQLGAILARRWQLSPLLTDAMTLHHGDSLDGSDHPDILDAVIASDQIVALANRSSSVSVDDLVQITRLRSAAERELVAETLTQCPAFVATFELHDRAATTVPSAVTPARHAGPLRETSFEVVDLARPGAQLRATGIGTNVLVVEGRAPVVVNRLVQLSLVGPKEPFTVWANPLSCEAQAGIYRIALKPFALSGKPLALWTLLVRG